MADGFVLQLRVCIDGSIHGALEFIEFCTLYIVTLGHICDTLCQLRVLSPTPVDTI